MSSRDNTDHQRFETLKRAVSDVGPIRRGSVDSAQDTPLE